MRLRTLVPLLAISATARASTPLHAPSPAAEASDGMRIEFSRPIDWRCHRDGGCVLCANLGAGDGDVLVVEPGGGRHAYRVPSGSSLRACPG